jgi:hypothetical protein
MTLAAFIERIHHGLHDDASVPLFDQSNDLVRADLEMPP